MFDSAFSDWMPGRPLLFGHPWHGRIDHKRYGSSLPARITLPNGSSFAIPDAWEWDTPFNSGFSQMGNTILFQDPRATPVERPPGQQAEDVLLGREWRHQAIVRPKRGVVNGREIINGSWAYSDGENVFAVSWGNPVRLYSQGVIARRHIGTAPVFTIPVTSIGDPKTPPHSPWAAEHEVVIDALPDGSKVLVATYIDSLSAMPEGMYASDADGEAWRHMPVVFREREIIKTGEGEYEAISRVVFDGDVTAGEVILRDTPALKSAAYWFELTGAVNKGPKSPGSGTHIWELTYEVEFGVATSGVGNFHPYYTIGSYSIEYGYRNRIVSAYYRPNGTIAKVTASAITSETHSGSSVSGSGTPAVVTCEGSAEMPDGITLATDTLSLTASMSMTQGATTVFELKNDGATVGTGHLEVSGSHSWSDEWSGIFARDGLIVGPGRSDGQSSVTFSRQWQLKIDGASIGGGSTADDDSYEHPDTGATFSSVRPVLSTWNPSIGAYAEFSVRDSSDRSLRAMLGPVSYCALMPAVLAVICPASGSNAGTTNVFAIGSGSLPFAGGKHEGFTSGAGPITEIYGSYNPVTGQYIRDAANPVSWA